MPREMAPRLSVSRAEANTALTELADRGRQIAAAGAGAGDKAVKPSFGLEAETSCLTISA